MCETSWKKEGRESLQQKEIELFQAKTILDRIVDLNEPWNINARWTGELVLKTEWRGNKKLQKQLPKKEEKIDLLKEKLLKEGTDLTQTEF